MHTILVVAIGLVGLVGVIFLVGLVLPRAWRVERSERIRATPEAIYPLIANFKDGWSRWNPFGRKRDPNLAMVFSGPAEGLGAEQRWNGKGMPAGRMSITEAVPGKSVRYVMHAAGFQVIGTLLCTRDGDQTVVTWSDEGIIANPFFRYFSLFVERAVGKPFEEGLAALKREAESAPRAPDA
jgi:hypothetical protein